MKIALVGSLPVPLTYGGTDRLLQGLREALDRQHPTQLVTPEVDERDEAGVLRGYYDFYRLDLSAYDAVISTKAPTFMVRHPVHIPYLQHRLRVFYDLYTPRDEHFARMRRLIHWMDGWALSPERAPEIFTIGRTVSNRLLRWGGLASTPIHHPTTFQPIEPRRGEYFFAVGRLHAWKRFDLLVRALRLCRADVELVIAGTGPEESALRELAGDDPRIRFTGAVDEQRLRELYAGALATVFAPIHEDLGMVTFESYLAGKPVLTTRDAGEPALIVQEGRSGWVCDPTPEALAERLDWIAAHRPEVEAMTDACRAAAGEVTWDRLTDALLAAARRRMDALARKAVPGADLSRGAAPSADRRIRLLVTDNQIIDPPVGGGRVRIWELYRHLPEDFVTTYVGTHDHPGPLARDRWLAPNFREAIMPLTAIHFKAHEVWRRLTRGDATIDVTIPLLLGRCSPRYRRLIGRFAGQADVLVTAHPWMTPFLPDLDGTPRVYDSQNCEAAVKFPMLRRTLAGRYLARRVESVERRALERADLTLACSAEDAAQFAQRYGAPSERILLVPNGVDCERIRPADPARRAEARARLLERFGIGGGPLAIFVGSNYGPNVGAVGWIVGQAPELPGVTFALAGGAIEQWRRDRPNAPLPANIRPLGTIDADDLLALYAAADAALNPIGHGSGTNIKMLDTMAAGLPIVCSATGARGLEGRAGEHWLAAEPQAFVRPLRELLENPDLQRRLGAAGRRLAEEHYDWRAIAAVYADALRRLVARRKAAPQ